jgi:transposase-like protein
VAAHVKEYSSKHIFQNCVCVNLFLHEKCVRASSENRIQDKNWLNTAHFMYFHLKIRKSIYLSYITAENSNLSAITVQKYFQNKKKLIKKLGIFPCQIQFQVNNKSTIIKL